MKRYYLFLILILGCCITTQAQTETTEQDTKKGAVLEFDKIDHDFGVIAFKGLAEVKFVCTNTGDEPAIIQRCQASCGCTTPTCPTGEPIKPGESKEITVRYNSTHSPGSFNKKVTVVSNAKEPMIVLSIKGRVLAEHEDYDEVVKAMQEAKEKNQ